MNIFGGIGNGFGGHGNGCGFDCCSLIWLLFLLSICGCNKTDCDRDNMGFGGCDCCSLIILLLLLSCFCGGHSCNN